MCADLRESPRRFMAEHQRLLHHKVTDFAVGVVVDVAATNPDRINGDAHVIRPHSLG